MTKKEWDAIPLETRQRFLDRVMAIGFRCILCDEHLTLSERAVGRSYCEDCWPGELEFDEE